MTLAPRVDGAVPVQSSAARFAAAFRQRVAAGLLTGRPHPRSAYQIVDERGDRLRVRAADFFTAMSVGLNDVELHMPSTGSVHFRVTYWRWAGYVIGLSGSLGVTGLVLLLTFDVRAYIANNTLALIPGLSLDQNLAIAWGSVIFWGFVWPWVLIGLHKRPLRRLLERIIRDVDGQAGRTGTGVATTSAGGSP